MAADIDRIILIKNKTRLERLTEQHNTMLQAQFSLKRQRENVEVQKDFLSETSKGALVKNRAAKKAKVESGEFSDYQTEHDNFYEKFNLIQSIAARKIKVKVVESTFIPNFIFTENDLVVVVGQDGLVANTAKYTNQLPIIGMNPDTSRYDGILLPFQPSNFEHILRNVLQNNYNYKTVTMAEVRLNDGQRLLAFNDFFIGPTSHTSAKYQITFEGQTENHSSSGLIVSTGAGSTGWMSSLFNMANGMQKIFGQGLVCVTPPLPWDTEKLVFVVREPFLSRVSQTNITGGFVSIHNELILESLMPNNGVIFSDGVLTDKLNFLTGTVAVIRIAPEKAKLVIP